MTEPTHDVYAALAADLRGPVASIQSYVRTLMAREDELSSSARATIHQVILQQSQRVDGFIDDVVLFVRLVTKSVEVEAERVLLPTLLEEARQRSGEPERVQISGADIVITADHTAFVSALKRLLRNALTYGPRKGTVQLSVAQEDGWVAITVRDEGRGVPDEALAAVFEPFVRSVQEDERRRDGFGLGLSIARELVALLGGTLILTPAAPGLAATIRLPAGPPA